MNIDAYPGFSKIETKTYTQKISELTRTRLASYIVDHAIIPSLDENYRLTENVYENLINFFDQCVCITDVKTLGEKELKGETKIEFVEMNKESADKDELLIEAISHGQKIDCKLYERESKENFKNFSVKVLKDMAFDLIPSDMNSEQLLEFLQKNVDYIKETYKKEFQQSTEEK